MAMDLQTIKKDRLRYTKNTLSANLTYVGILFNVLYFLSIYQSDVNNYYYTITIGLSVVYNLIFLLVAFLGSEGIKNYKLNYAFVLIGIGVLQGVRIFGIPRMAHEAMTTIEGVEVPVMGDQQFALVVVYLLISGVACIVAGAFGAHKTYVLETYKKDNGLE